MRYLVDTHIWLWLLESPERINADVRLRLQQAEDLVLSVASVWEVAIKVHLNRLNLDTEAARREFLSQTDARELPIESSHALAAAALPTFHRDPFDRVLIAQAITDGLTLVTADTAIRQYQVALEWAT